MPDGVALVDSDGRIRFANAVLEHMLGYAPGELHGVPVEVVVPEGARARHEEHRRKFAAAPHRRTMAAGRALHALRKDGSELVVHVSLGPIVTDQGRFVLAAIRDMRAENERQAALEAAEAARRRSEARFRAIVESSSDVMLLLSRHGVVLYASRSWCEDCLTAGWEGRDLASLVEPADAPRVRTLVESAAARPEESHRAELRLRTARGVARVFEALASSRLEDPELEAIVVTCRDVTERRSLEEQFLQVQKMDAVGRLAGGVAHDFNNLLSVILGYTSMLLESAPADHEDTADLREIHQAAGRAAELTRQLLAFSRKQVFELKLLDLNAVVTSMSRLLRALLGEDIELVLELDPTSGHVRADATQLEQVVLNLVVNARDAMPRGGRLSIETAARDLGEQGSATLDLPQGRYVLLSVRDEGEGMDAETRARIFEPFFTTKDVGKGTGLGLSTVFGIVRQSGGTVAVDSEPGQGSTFRVYLPRAEVGAETAAAKDCGPVSSSGPGTILLVEDEEQVRRLALTILRRAGFRVLEAEGPTQALALAEAYTGRIDLVLTDVVMPEMNGREFVQALAPKLPDVRVLYMSGYTERAIVHRGVLEPGIAFLQKPVTPDRLLAAVRRAMDPG